VIPYRLRGDRLEVIVVFHGRQEVAEERVSGPRLGGAFGANPKAG
jgi:hypothetical protein